MEEACDGSTLRGRNPEIGTSGIEDNLEALGRSSKLYFGVIWHVSPRPERDKYIGR